MTRRTHRNESARERAAATAGERSAATEKKKRGDGGKAAQDAAGEAGTSVEASARADAASPSLLDPVAFGHLAAAMAHDVRGPLNTMGIHVELASTRLRALAAASGPESAGALAALGQSLEAVRREIERSDEILSRYFEAVGPRERERETIAVEELLRSACARARSDAQRRGVRLAIDAKDAGRWTLDAEALRLAIGALVENAVQASPPGATVTLRAASDGDKAVIEVVDQGAGIAAEALPRIFRLGYSTIAGRAGVGLTIAKHAVRGHGGSLSIGSAGAGQGTRGRIELPADQMAGPEAERATDEPDDDPPHAPADDPADL